MGAMDSSQGGAFGRGAIAIPPAPGTPLRRAGICYPLYGPRDSFSLLLPLPEFPAGPPFLLRPLPFVTMAQSRTLRRLTHDATRIYNGASALAGIFFYYGFVPAVVIAGLTTIEGGLSALTGGQPAPSSAETA